MAANSYVRLVKTNRTYRRFWLAAFVSMFGEWFNTIALFVIILKYTDSELLLGILMAVRMGSFALMQPLFGLLADRVNRKKIDDNHQSLSNWISTRISRCEWT